MRIAVNQEVLNLSTFLDTCPKNFLETALSHNSKQNKQLEGLQQLQSLLLIITFHSLEERLVSQAMARWKKAKLGDLGTKKAVTPSEEELAENSRSASAKLFCFLFDYNL